jgi:hypothetical protein
MIPDNKKASLGEIVIVCVIGVIVFLLRTNGQNLIETPESVGFWGFLGVLSRGS